MASRILNEVIEHEAESRAGDTESGGDLGNGNIVGFEQGADGLDLFFDG